MEDKLTEFTPLSALAGGILIGTSAVMLFMLNGRIAGISGIAGGLLRLADRNDLFWRFCFVAGLVAAPWLVAAISGAPAPAPALPGDAVWMAAGGLLVGFGTAIGGGCTSGHGVCGIARLSARSIVATMTFMAAGGVTVFVIRHVLGAGA
ncbi:MAG: YeeE/YedE family protein [Minwuia sp.]|uniref:YeeE/YedE family protein n=1 Tax=Minwuia sp. TaxID=2493630 RepID=UPI003A86EBC5